MSASSQHFSLRWNDYLRHITQAFDTLRTEDHLVDVTLSCEGKRIRAHKMLLSACSTYFRDLFKENPCQHPIIILKNVKFDDLEALIDFMYQGEVNVVQDQLTSFLTTAELLAVQGLTDGSSKDIEEPTPASEITLEPQKSTSSRSPKYTTDNRSPSPTSKSSKKRRRTQQIDEVTIKKPAIVHDDDDDDEVTFVPITMPTLKVELPEYLDSTGDQLIEQNSEIDDGDNSCDYENEPKEMKHDSLDMSNLVYEAQADDLSGTEMSQMLGNPGPSDSLQQDSALQGTSSSTAFGFAVPLHSIGLHQIAIRKGPGKSREELQRLKEHYKCYKELHVRMPGPQRRCVYCSSKKIDYKTYWMCGYCNIGLCFTEKRNCFALFHNGL